MKKKQFAGVSVALIITTMAGVANAALTTIGTATYNGADYKLIWDNDNNGNSIVWLDYTHPNNNSTSWAAHSAWAAGLDSALTYNIAPGYTVDWGSNTWRLPSAGADPVSGFGQTTSEMGHLYIDELGLASGWSAQTTADLQATIFDNLTAKVYWSETPMPEYGPEFHWDFWMDSGYQFVGSVSLVLEGIAVRNGQVTATPAPVPIPAAVWLFGSGLLGLMGFSQRRRALIHR